MKPHEGLGDEPLIIEAADGSLVLKQLTVADAETMFAAIEVNRDHLRQFNEDTADKYPNLDAVIDSLVNPKDPTKLRFGIWDGEIFVGSVNLRPSTEMNDAEIGYWISGAQIKKGYAKAAAKLATDYALETMGLDYVYARIHPENHASKGVVTSLGYKQVHRNSTDTYDYFSTALPEAIQVTTLYEDKYGSIATIALQGANTPTVNHGSDTRYAVLSGGALFNVNGEDHLVLDGESIFIPRGSTYSDAGKAQMLAVSMPPFDPEKVERF